MTERPENLPDFERPPLVEVVLGAQFSRIQNLATLHLGLLWQRFRSKLPKWRELPPLDPTFEIFSPRGQPRLSIEVGLGFGPVPRVWFINDDDTQLIQFQADRFLHNWRRVGNNTTYPRYEGMREEFSDAFDELSAFLKEEQLEFPPINQCEVSYINNLYMPDGSDPRISPQEFLKFCQSPDFLSSAVDAEDIRFLVRQLVRDSQGKPYARLLISLDPGFDQEGRPVLVLTLTVRGKPHTGDLGAALQFFDDGREKIVRRFTEITTGKMHQEWGRIK